MTTKTVQIAGISVQLTRKAVKNINLRVSREGRVNVKPIYPWRAPKRLRCLCVESDPIGSAPLFLAPLPDEERTATPPMASDIR